VRAAESDQDAAVFLTAAFTGLRQGELLALRWRDVDFERRVIRLHRTYKSGNGVDTPKSGRGRSVPMADEVAQALARLGEREDHTGDDDLVFRGPRGHVNAQKLGYRYKAALRRAGLRELRFHDLRHTFGTIAINGADIVQVQAWMGHADIKTNSAVLALQEPRERGGAPLWRVCRRRTRGSTVCRMTAKEKLLKTVEGLSEKEAESMLSLIDAELGEHDPVLEHFERAPEDDEPTTPEEDKAADEAWAGYERGESVPLERVSDEED
jgi:hypothetical protein